MGNGLKLLRERADMTHAEAGEAMGISRGAFIKLERGERRLSGLHIAKAMEAFHATRREVLGDQMPTVPVLGLVNAGSDFVTLADGQGPFDEVSAPDDATDTTVAVEIRGDSLGSLLNGFIAYYDDRREPVTPDLIGQLCVVGLTDDRVVIKRIEKGRTPGRFDLFGSVGPAIYDAEVTWAALVTGMRPRWRA